MSEILLQTLVEKFGEYQKQLEGLQKSVEQIPDNSPILEQINHRMDQIEAKVEGIPGRISIPEQKLETLEFELMRNTDQLRQPLKQEVLHHHHLSKPVWACLAMGSIVMVMTAFLTLAWAQARQHRDADIKYRYTKLFAGPGALEYLNYVDSLYLSNPDQMRKKVTQEEDRRQEEFEKQQRLKEKKEEVKELEKETGDGKRGGR